MVKGLPYKLQEGQVAYARKVMANFEALLASLNNVTVDGKTGDLDTILQELFDRAVLTGEANSEDITFEDGESLQDKYDSGKTALALMTGEGMFYFYVEDGRLKVVTNGNINADDFTIDGKGHLIYTINPSENNAPPAVYDLGRVQGDKGDPGQGGDMFKTTYDPNNKEKDVCHYYGCFQCNWENGIAKITDKNLSSTGGDTLTGKITATEGHFMYKPAQGSDDETWKMWWDASVICTSQGVDEDGSWFELKALGKTPSSLYLDVDMWI